jgi:fucose permease
MVSKSFFYPTFTPYLVNTYHLSIESSSVFFVIHMVSYLIMLQFLQDITHKLGIKLTIVVGLLLNFMGVLLLPPIGVLPQYLL